MRGRVHARRTLKGLVADLRKYTTIMRAIAKVGTTEGATPIKRLCDDSITFDDIRVVMAEYISLHK